MTTTRVVEVFEYERRSVDLTADQARRLNQSKALTLTPSLDTSWEIKAAQYVGVVQVDALEVHIRPKVPTRRLLFLLAFAMRPDGWQDLLTLLGAAAEPIEAIAHAFCHHAEAALHHGLLQGYRTVEEAIPGLRGRLREGDQLRRRFGMVVPVEVTYDDFTPDIAENRLLLTAARRLLLLRTILPDSRIRLQRLMRKLASVTPLAPGEPIPSIRIDRRTQRYAHAIALAALILRTMTVEIGDRSHAATSFLFDMNKVFEDFVTAALAATFRGHIPHLVAQQVSYLDEGETLKFKPDITWVADGETVAVADLKYKSLGVKDLQNADVYQMLAYCTALRLRSGHLVYAAGNEQPSRRTIRNTPIEIVTWAVPLSMEPSELLETIATFGRSLVGWGRSDTQTVA